MANDIYAALSNKRENKPSSLVSGFTEMFGGKVQTKITTLPISKLREKDNHPFKVIKDDRLLALAESIKENGLMEPIIVRAIDSDTYEILAGHRRTTAVNINGDKEIKAIVIDADDELANRIMISTNFEQRESYLPSEIAKSYLIRYTDLKNSRKENGENSNGWNLEKIDKIMEKEFCTSKSKVYMYLRLNHLIPEMLDMADSKRANLKVAVEISYLRDSEQRLIYKLVYEDKAYKLDLKKASEIKRESSKQELYEIDIVALLSDSDSIKLSSVFFSQNEVKKYKNKFNSLGDMKQAIINFLENY